MSAFTYSDSVFFLGGIGAKTGLALSGGCTQTFFEDADNSISGTIAGGGDFDLNTIMGTDGAAKAIPTGGIAAGQSDTITWGEDAEVLKIKVGMAAYLTGVNIIPAIYTVISVTDIGAARQIQFDTAAAIGPTSNATGNFGGAFDSLASVCGATSATAKNCTVYTNSPEDLASTQATWPEGTKALNTFWELVGFNLSPYDMDLGGDYHQGINDAFRFGINENKHVAYDRNGGDQVANFNGGENRKFRNIGFKDTDDDAVISPTKPDGLFFDHCFFYTGRRMIGNGDIDSLHVNDCFFKTTKSENGNVVAPGSGSNLFVTNSIIECTVNFAISSVDGSCVEGNILYNVTGLDFSGVRLTGATSFKNNTIYGFSAQGIWVVAEIIGCIVNNIIVPEAKATAPSIELLNGSVVNDYNCLWAIDGEPTEEQALQTTAANGTAPSLGANSIIADPQFMDAANKDFRLKPTSPCINTGKRTSAGGYSSMGAWRRKSFLGVD